MTMNVSEYCSRVTEIVLELTDVTEDDLRNRRKTAEVVDARWLIVRLARDAGYYPSQIARELGLTTRWVQFIVSYFDTRLQYGEPSLRINYELATKLLGSN